MMSFKGPVFVGVLLENCKENSFNDNQNTIPGMTKTSTLVQLPAAICKPRHWNLGIGIGIGTGIGTDTTNVIISSSIRPMDTKPSRVVILDEESPPTKSRDTSISWSRDK